MWWQLLCRCDSRAKVFYFFSQQLQVSGVNLTIKDTGTRTADNVGMHGYGKAEIQTGRTITGVMSHPIHPCRY